MTRQELGQQPNPENGNTRIADPAELMRYNPAALIYNKETYDSMSARFFPSLCQPIHTVKVSTYSMQHGEVIREFVIDGMTRTKFVNDNWEKITRENPDFRFRAQDTTDERLQNPKIVPVEEKTEGQQALTMLQYLRAVIPPTIEHSQIASDRIAAHLINGWENMVGADLTRKYSALAALSLLGNQTINIATNEGLRRDLSRQERLMAEETIEERVILQQKLLEMAAIIRQTRLQRQELAQSAFMLVGTESSVIGGEREAKKQIYGLLYTSEVERKLTQAFSNISEREQMRDQLGRFIADAFKRVGTMPNREGAINVLGETLRNPQLNFNNVYDVFTAPNPVERYREVQQEVNKDRLTRVYMSSHVVQNLNAVESELIERLGTVTNLSDAQIEGLTTLIKSADVILKRADSFREQITKEREKYLESGVSRQLLDEADPKVQAAQEAIKNARSLQILRTANSTLITTLDEHDRRMKNQINRHKITGMVDEVTLDKLRARVRGEIIDLVFIEFREVTEQNQEAIQTRIQQYASVDNDLFGQVRDSDISLSRALNIQRQRELKRERDRAVQQAPVPPVQPTPVVEIPPAVPIQATIPPETRVEIPIVIPPTVETPVDTTQLPVETTPIVPVESTLTVPVQPTALSERPRVPPSVGPQEMIVDPQHLEERRKQVNREKYNRELSNFYRLLDEIDLAPQDITDTEREGTDLVVRCLGRLVYEWPDAARILREEYRRLLEENRVMREELLGRRREDTDRDTKTSR